MSLPSSEARPRGVLSCFNKRLVYSCALIAISQINFGMDQSAFSNTQAMPAFKEMFGTYNEATGTYALDTVYLSLLNSINYVGFVFGLVTGNLLSRRFGRRKALFIMCFWAIVAAIILVTSRHRVQMVVGRTVAYVYIGMELALVPVLQSELVPAEVRGLVVGTYQSGLLFGQLLMAVICRGTSELEGHSSWRIPLGLFFVIPSILAVGIWWIPESPRWLLTRGRSEEARESLKLLRENAYTDEEIESEFSQIQISLERVTETGSFSELFQGTNRKRTLITIGVNIFLQLTGQNFISVYGTVFIQSLGSVNPFMMSCINSSAGIIMVLFAQSLVDRTGRVPLMVAGGVIQTGALMTMGGLGTVTDPSSSIRKGIVSMTTIFNIGFCMGWAPLSHVVSAEIPTTRLRDLTYALASSFNVVIQFTISFTIPYLLNKPYAGLGSKVGFIFGSTSVLACIFAWFCIPECSGKSLEEIDELFLAGVPIGRFGKTKLTEHVEDVEDLKK
ncbi:general substrate transporter [Ilyonectria robusta]|uniref:general substrate transporter n=1 Tax=Ilyonectria robusta TaxID=1079257 RepID=UPI001E8D62A9|nr:general substrate transporter [Ilyonectria robusta]KAH8714587.1 general substrate transporter [Ilyonectria robusta]